MPNGRDKRQLNGTYERNFPITVTISKNADERTFSRAFDSTKFNRKLVRHRAKKMSKFYFLRVTGRKYA